MCSRFAARTAGRHDTITAVVPRNCLSNPHWVEAGGGSGYLVGDRFFADDANLDGTVGDEPTYGPRLRRG